MERSYNSGDEPVPGYRLVRFLGGGAIGRVWKATAPGGAEAALKIINLAGSGIHGRKEFGALQLVKRIRHPNLAPIIAFWLKNEDGTILDDAYAVQGELAATEASRGPLQETMVAPPDVGRLKATELLIAMGLGDQSLSDRLKQCREQGLEGIPREELLGYMEDAAKAIDFLNSPVHDLGAGPVAIQHCDIKPLNLLVVGGAVQVCDFGLAHMVGVARSTAAALGTIAYAAPELLEGKPSTSTDQYCLAISYFELKTGTLPYDHETAGAVMRAILHGELNYSKLPEAEQAVLRRATARKPAERYSSALEMAHALREASTAGVPTPRKRSRVPRAVAVLALAVLVALGALRVVKMITMRIQRPPGEPPASEAIAENLSQPHEPAVDKTSRPPAAETTVDSSSRPPAAETTVETSTRPPAAEAHFHQGCRYLGSQPPDFDQAIVQFEEAMRLDPDGTAGFKSRPEYAEAHLGRGTEFLKAGKFEQAIADFSAGIVHNPKDVRLFSRRGVAWFTQDQWQKAVEDLTVAIQIDASDLDLVYRGQAYQKLGKADRAVADFEAAIQKNPDNAEAHYLLAEHHLKSKDYQRAIARYSQAIEKYPQTPNPFFDLEHAYFYRGSCHLMLGGSNLDEADRDFTQALELPGDLGRIDGILAELAAALADAKRLPDAVKWAKKAVELAPDEASRETYRMQLKQYESQSP